MQYLFRSPVFPVIFKSGIVVVYAATRAELNRYVKKNASNMPEECELVDYNWDEWNLYPSQSLLVPAIVCKQITKRKLLVFCGVSEEQISTINLDKYSRKQVFDLMIPAAKRGSQLPIQAGDNKK